MNIINLTKSLLAPSVVFCALSNASVAQQWLGEDNATAPILRSGAVGIGTTLDPRQEDTLLQLQRPLGAGEGLFSARGTYNGASFSVMEVDTKRVAIGAAATKDSFLPSGVFDLTVGRSVAIGMLGIEERLPTEYKLVVAGKVLAEEVRVQTVAQWSDYVFEPDYELRSLPEVADFIETHRHLPDIPSAAEVERDGIGIVEMQSKLLLKIEELTLHMIEQHETIERLQRKLADLEKGEG